MDAGQLVVRDAEGVLIAAINMGDFATINGLAEKTTVGDGSYTWNFPEGTSIEDITVTIAMSEKSGYRDQYLIHQLERTNDRVDYASDRIFANFQSGLAEGLRFFTANEGPYLVHCTEGKDRANFVSALLACYMGATYDEVVSDYMVIYEKYYHLTKGSEQYEAVKSSNIVSVLSAITGLDSAALPSAGLSAAAAAYIKGIGLSDAECAALRANLAKDHDAAPIETPVETPAETPAVPETPAAPEVPAISAPAGSISYTVQSGDCLWNITYKLYKSGARWTEIYELNKTAIKDPDMIQVGQVLIVPAACGTWKGRSLRAISRRCGRKSTERAVAFPPHLLSRRRRCLMSHSRWLRST